MTTTNPETLTADTPAASPKPLTLSPSRVADFMTCPLLYRFRVIDKLPEPPSPAAARGTLVHAVLEHLFDAPAPERTKDHAFSLLVPQWQQLVTKQPEVAGLFHNPLGQTHVGADDSDNLLDFDEWLNSCRVLLERYFALEDPQRLEPADRELYVRTDLAEGPQLRGIVDRLDVAPDGAMRVVDYKTGRAPGPGFESTAMFQMRFYAVVLWQLRGTIPRVLQMLYLGSGDVLRYEPDEWDLQATTRKLHALWGAIQRAHTSGNWRARPSKLCDFCAHRDTLCPAWGGTPPPLPSATAPLTGGNNKGESVESSENLDLFDLVQ